jgi:CheY-like chemotaxis protein
MAPKILVVDDNQELLSLLVQLFEDSRYTVIGASKGKQAQELAKQHKLDAAIIDVLLPDMMGYNLAEALRKDHPTLPLFFITGVFKGGKHALEAKSKFGPTGYFEKPFEAKKLLEAVSKQVPPPPAPAASAEPPVEDAFEVELDIDVEEDQPTDAMELTGRIKVTGGDNITAELRGANLTAGTLTKEQVAGAVRPPPAGTPAPAPPTRAQGGKSRRGEIKDNIPSLITAFYLSKETGELGVQKGKVKKVLYFENGTPVFALSNLLSDRFGQFLVRVGKIKSEDLTDAAAVAAASKRRTGDVLVERGLLKDTERMYYVGQQVKAIIYSLFGWEDGTYVMSFKEQATAESIKLDVHPANLIVRGIKKLYKPERLRNLVHPEDRFIPSHQPAYALNEVELDRWEADLLPKIDGTRNVAELLAIANKPEHQLNAFLCAMLSLSILERREGA